MAKKAATAVATKKPLVHWELRTESNKIIDLWADNVEWAGHEFKFWADGKLMLLVREPLCWMLRKDG